MKEELKVLIERLEREIPEMSEVLKSAYFADDNFRNMRDGIGILLSVKEARWFLDLLREEMQVIDEGLR